MVRSLPNLANNLSEGTHKIKCKYGQKENVKLLEFHRKYATVFLNIQTFKDDLIQYKSLCTDKNYLQRLKET